MKIDFEFSTQHGIFRDALYFPDDQVPDEATIQAMKEERVNNWIAVITAPPPPEPPTTLEINGLTYQRLQGIPPSGAHLVEVDGTWYYRE